MSHTTRRGLLGALGVAGLASLGSGSASAQLGGGPEADAMSEYRVPTYRVPESDLDSPGVVGRRVEITAGGSTYSAGDQLVDLGDRWELVSPNYGSVSTDDATIGNADTVSGGPIGDTDEIVPFDPIPVAAEGGTFSTNSTGYVKTSPTVAGYVVFDTPPTNTTLKMRFAGDVDVNPADVRFGLGDQNGNFNGSYGAGGTTTSAEVAGYTGRSPQPTDWFDVDDNARGQPLVKVKQPDGNDVFVRSMMVQFGYEVNG